MLALIQHNLLLLAVCFLIGAATAWWMFRGARRNNGKGKG